MATWPPSKGSSGIRLSRPRKMLIAASSTQQVAEARLGDLGADLDGADRRQQALRSGRRSRSPEIESAVVAEAVRAEDPARGRSTDCRTIVRPSSVKLSWTAWRARRRRSNVVRRRRSRGSRPFSFELGLRSASVACLVISCSPSRSTVSVTVSPGLGADGVARARSKCRRRLAVDGDDLVARLQAGRRPPGCPATTESTTQRRRLRAGRRPRWR